MIEIQLFLKYIITINVYALVDLHAPIKQQIATHWVLNCAPQTTDVKSSSIGIDR